MTTLSFSEPQKVWFVGDIHGQYTLLLQSLQQVGFDPLSGDHLIATGDLVDCGPENEAVLALLNEPWFHSVKGNHEKMALAKSSRVTACMYDHLVHYLHQQGGLRAVQLWRAGLRSEADTARLFELAGESVSRWIYNGGGWFFSATRSYAQQQLVMEQLRAANLPYTIECQLPGAKIGVLHADVIGNCWNNTKQHAADNEHATLFSREGFRRLCNGVMTGQLHYSDAVISNADAVVFGHCITPTNQPMFFGNRAYLDVGAKGGALPCVMSAESLLSTLGDIKAKDECRVRQLSELFS